MAKPAPPAKPQKMAKPEKAAKPKKAPKPAPAAKVEEPKVEKPVEVRAPADPRLKVLKKFHGKFLPKGVLRTRQKAIMDRWNSGDDRGGVTVEELKSLLADWRGTQEKPPRLPTA